NNAYTFPQASICHKLPPARTSERFLSGAFTLRAWRRSGMPQIVVEELRKTFHVAERRKGLLGAVAGLVRRTHRDVHALEGISFTMQPGELVGYIGPNGAGKSTTVKILSGILTPTSGRCEIGGITPWKNRAAHVARIGVVFGQRTQL